MKQDVFGSWGWIFLLDYEDIDNNFRLLQGSHRAAHTHLVPIGQSRGKSSDEFIIGSVVIILARIIRCANCDCYSKQK